MTKVAVIGGGIFGATAAVELARSGMQVDLYERHQDILLGASRANQGRLHMGYHYPRSVATAEATRDAATKFAKRFSGAITYSGQHFYGIARDNSLTDGTAFLNFCNKLNLPYQRCSHALINDDAVSTCVAVPERYVDIVALRTILHTELVKFGVKMYLGREVRLIDLNLDDDYTWVVCATYGMSSEVPLRYEVCETALVRLNERYLNLSFVIMDGPFTSLDPVPNTDMHMLYDVEHSVHAASVGYAPSVPTELMPLLDRGVVYTPHTHVESMLRKARRYLRDIDPSINCGSLFTVRAVLPDVDGTDERPTRVNVQDNVIMILSGKIGTAVTTADQVRKVIVG